MNNASNIAAIVVAPWMESFTIVRAVILVLMVVLGAVLIFSVLIQPSGGDGVGALTGQSTDTFYSKNKKQSVENFMKRLTVIIGITLGVLAILFFVTIIFYDPTTMTAAAAETPST